MGYSIYDNCDSTAVTSRVSTHLATDPRVIGVLSIGSADFAKVVAQLTTAFYVPTVTYMYNDEDLMDRERFPTLVSLIESKEKEGRIIKQFLREINFTYMDIWQHSFSSEIARYVSEEYLEGLGCGRVAEFDRSTLIPRVVKDMYNKNDTIPDVQLLLQNSKTVSLNWLKFIQGDSSGPQFRSKIYVTGSSNGRETYHREYRNILRRQEHSDDTMIYLLPFLLNTQLKQIRIDLERRWKSGGDKLDEIYRNAQKTSPYCNSEQSRCWKTGWATHVIAAAKLIVQALEENLEPAGSQKRDFCVLSLRRQIFKTIVNETRVVDIDLGEDIHLKIRFKDNMIHYPMKIGVYQSRVDEYHNLGEALSDSIQISNLSLLQSLSRYRKACSEDCQAGSYTDRDYSSALTCCWKCRTCPPNHFSNTVNQNGCEKCKQDEFSPENSTSCKKVDVIYIQTGSDIFVGGVAVFAVGILSVVVTAILVGRNETRPIIKASEPGYIYVLLFSVGLGFMGSFAALLEPSQLTCTLEYVLLVIFSTLVTANLLWKCIKISSIFAAANSFKRPRYEPLLKRAGHLFILITSLIFVTTFLIIDGYVTKFGWRFAHLQEPHQPDYPTCLLQDGLPGIICLLPLILPASYFLAVLFLSLKMRNFPHNFRETLNILVATLVVLFCSVIFLSGYTLSPPETKALLRSIIFFITSSAFLVCLMLPKVVAVVRKSMNPEEERRVIQQSLRVFCNKVSASQISLPASPANHAGGRKLTQASVLSPKVPRNRSVSPKPGRVSGQVTTPGLGPRKLNQPNKVARSSSVPLAGTSATSRWKRGVDIVRAKSASIK
ncbi:hypothetical protein ACHWQZ_G018840 [Mnemiopsis leidyi]